MGTHLRKRKLLSESVYVNQVGTGIQFSSDLKKRTTLAEETMKRLLMNLHLKFVFQKPFFVPFKRQLSYGLRKFYIVDFDIPQLSLVVEVDGKQHSEPKAQDYDSIRDAWLRRDCYREVRRFTNDQVLNNPDWVQEELLKIMEGRGFRILSRA